MPHATQCPSSSRAPYPTASSPTHTHRAAEPSPCTRVFGTPRPPAPGAWGHARLFESGLHDAPLGLVHVGFDLFRGLDSSRYFPGLSWKLPSVNVGSIGTGPDNKLTKFGVLKKSFDGITLFCAPFPLFRYCVCTVSRNRRALALFLGNRENTTRILSRKSLEMLASSIRLLTLLKAQMYYYVFPPLVSTGRYR